MPEGPEVRRYATLLAEVLDGETVVEVAARTREAKAWLLERPQILEGRRIRRVRSRGKHLVVEIEGEFYLH
ncbi:MAG TPA: DNA-formamidopyrimidine glycosylase family protein, partial [Abditibacteriaceae bacterium]